MTGLNGERKRIGFSREAKLTLCYIALEGGETQWEDLESVGIACKHWNSHGWKKNWKADKGALNRVTLAYELNPLSYSLRGINNACDSFLITI